MFKEPITNKEFFGRPQQITVLRERAKAFRAGFRQNIAILGRPFIGKTFLLHNFLSDLLSQEIIPIYIEARDEPFYFFIHRFIGSLLYRYLKLKGHEDKKGDLNALIKASKKKLPKTIDEIERIKKLFNKKDFDGAYDALLQLPKTIEADSGLLCAVIIEEFDKLINYRLTQPFFVLGKKIMLQRNTFYVLTSSVKHAKQILSEKLQLLFGNFEILELKEFDFPTSRNFLAKRLEPFGISEEYIKFLIAFTDGHPFYLDVIASGLKKLLLQQKKQRVTTKTLEKVLNKILFYPWGRLHQHFINIVNRHCSRNGIDVLSVLVSLSEGRRKLRDLSESLNNPFKKVSRAILHLQNSGIVVKIGAFNNVEDSLLRFWLRSVCHKGRIDFTQNPANIEKSFAVQIKKFSTDFAKESKEDMYEKITALFKSFRDDIVKIEQKKHRLPFFNDVATRIIGESGPYIIGHSRGKNWICQIRERQVSEKQIFDFLKDARAGKYKFHRNILIVIKGMDDNAKLLCKEAGIWIWNLKTLNLLLDLYDKHKVVIY